MSNELSKAFSTVKDAAKKGIEKIPTQKIDVDAAKEMALRAAKEISVKAVEVKDKGVVLKEEIDAKIHELDQQLEAAITEYNDAYTLMNDKGVKLYVERCRTLDTVTMVEGIVNSLANRPKSFDADFDEIETNRSEFENSCSFANKELYAARVAAGGAGAGLAAGASVAFMAPTAAMWIATTFGTASTGTAIATLSGAAASNAALAWLGGGALAAGGGGISAGSALLALAGPIGWSIAGATLLSSIVLFATKRTKLNKQKNDEISEVKNNIELVKEMDVKIGVLLNETEAQRTNLNQLAVGCMSLCGRDYSALSNEQKTMLGTLVNHTKVLSALLEKTVD